MTASRKRRGETVAIDALTMHMLQQIAHDGELSVAEVVNVALYGFISQAFVFPPQKGHFAGLVLELETKETLHFRSVCAPTFVEFQGVVDQTIDSLSNQRSDAA